VLALGNPIVTMKQPSQLLMSMDATAVWGTISTVRCSLPESEMRAVLVEVANVFREQTFEMLLIHRNNVVEEVSSAAFAQRSATPFCQGLSKEIRTGSIFRERTAMGTSSPYLEYRSKIRNLGADSNGNASRNCWTIHWLVGCRVTLKCRMRRRPGARPENQSSMPQVTVGTVKKSIAAIASRWFRREASHRWAESDSLGARFIRRETVLSERSKPSMRSPPWMRGAPQVDFRRPCGR
jgi:hypothetical protein